MRAVLGVLLLAGVAAMLRPRGERVTAAPAPPIGPPVRTLAPGFYWLFVEWASAAYLMELLSREAKRVRVHAVYGVPDDPARGLVLIQVFEPIAWTTSEEPIAEPRGIYASPADVLGPETPAWRQWLEQRASAAVEALRAYDAQLQRWLTERLYGPKGAP